MAYQPKSYRKFVATAATATLVASAIAPVAGAASNFTDVAPKYKDAVDYLVANNITQGATATTFGTHENIKRGDLAIWLAKALKLDTASAPASGFADTAGTRYDAAVSVLKAKGYINGKTATEFAPSATVTRGEMAIMLSNAYDLKSVEATKFTDAVGNYKTAIQGLYAYGVTTGKSDTLFGTSMNITRGDLAIFLKRAAEVVKSPSVVGVSALNGKELVVNFNQAVDADTAETVGNYIFSDGNTVVANGAEVLADGKSVKLTLTSAYTEETSVAVTVKNVGLKSNPNTKFPIFAQTITINDTVKPEIASVDSITNGSTATKAVLTFTEPVQAGAVIKVNGTTVTTTTAGYETELTGLSLDASKSHTVEVINLKDAAGNVTSYTSKSFTVNKDAAAPTVASVSPYGDYQVLVTFDKKIEATTVAAGDVAVKDELLNNVPVSGFAALSGDTTGTKFVVTLDKAQAAVSGMYDNKTTRNFTLVFADKSVSDKLGNKLAATTKAVSLSQDETAPTVTGLTFKKDATSKEITELKVTFDEEIANSFDLSKFTVVDANGVLKTSILNGASVTVTGKEAVINIADQVLTGKYSFQIGSGASTDLALDPNKTKAYSGVVDFGANAVAGTFDFVDGDSNLTNGEVTENANVITVTYPVAVKGGLVAGSATDVNNYTLNGKSLPAGTTITLDGTQKVATITLAGESISTGDVNAVFTINNVQSLTDKTVKPVTTTVSVVDNVSPVLQSARVLDNNTIELTYSEAMANISGASVGEEFTIYEGTTAKALSDVQLLATRVSGYNNKVVVDLQGAATLDLTQAISIKALVPATGADVVDLGNGNKQKANVKIDVAKN